MSFIDNCTDLDIDSLQEKNMMLQYLAELYNAMLEVAIERSVDMSYSFLKDEAKRRMALGTINHCYTEEEQPDIESYDE